MLAVNTLGQLTKHPRVQALREFITSWYLSYITADNTRNLPEAGPQERLSKTGDNLPNVIQYLSEQHPECLELVRQRMVKRVPRLEKVLTEIMPDGRLLLQIKDAPFNRPVLSKYASDGTMKMLAYLTVLHDPDPPRFIGLEEPENHLNPWLLHELAEECRFASARSQVLITTHSPYFVNGLRPKEVWLLARDDDGYTQARRAADDISVKDFMSHGALLGDLWMELRFSGL
jgi:predicted ATPase